MATTVCTIEEGSERHGRYNVWMGEWPLVANGRDPEHEACRVLVEMGVTGPVEFRDRATGMLRMSYRSIEAAAKLSVVETNRDGLVVTQWKPFSGTIHSSQSATDDLEAVE